MISLLSLIVQDPSSYQNLELVIHLLLFYLALRVNSSLLHFISAATGLGTHHSLPNRLQQPPSCSAVDVLITMLLSTQDSSVFFSLVIVVAFKCFYFLLKIVESLKKTHETIAWKSDEGRTSLVEECKSWAYLDPVYFSLRQFLIGFYFLVSSTCQTYVHPSRWVEKS